MDRQTATGLAAGVTLAVIGGATAIVLTAGPSIAAAFDGNNTEIVSESDQQPATEPTVYVVDENGNLITPDANAEQRPTDDAASHDAANTYEVDEPESQHEEYEDDDYEEQGQYEEYEDDDYEDDDYEGEDDHD